MIRKNLHCALLAALLALSGTPARAGGPAPAGTSIDTLVSIAYQSSPDGDTQIVSSNDASVAVGVPATVGAQIPVKSGVALTSASGSQSMSRLTRVVFPVTLRNTGGGTDTFTLTLIPAGGWHAALVYDLYGDGVLHTGENTLAPAQVSLAAGSSRPYLVVVTPPVLLASGASGTTVLRAASGVDAAKAAQITLTTSFTGGK